MKSFGESVRQIDRMLREGMEIRTEHTPGKTVDDLEREFAFAKSNAEDSAEIKVIRSQLRALFEMQKDAHK